MKLRTVFFASLLCVGATSAQAVAPVLDGAGHFIGMTGVFVDGVSYDITWTVGDYVHVLPDILSPRQAGSVASQINPLLNSQGIGPIWLIAHLRSLEPGYFTSYMIQTAKPVPPATKLTTIGSNYEGEWNLATFELVKIDDVNVQTLFVSAGPSCQWVYSSGGATNFQNVTGGYALSKLGFGDFDGDGKTDVFSATPVSGGYQWLYSSGSTKAFQNLAQGPAVSTLTFGKFDGDAKTDVFYAQLLAPGSYQWKLSSGGAKTFKNLRRGPYPTGFGDFDGDGKTDAFYAKYVRAGVYQWMYSSSASKSFKNLAVGPYPSGFGDFDGNGKTDVFYAQPLTEGVFRWKYSPDGAGNFRYLARGPYPDAFGDFDGDGKTDVFSAQPLTGGVFRWKYSSGGATTFRYLARGPAISYLRFGDFDGDGKTDVFSANGAYCR